MTIRRHRRAVPGYQRAVFANLRLTPRLVLRTLEGSSTRGQLKIVGPFASHITSPL
jgi:hypothetical protein